MPDNWKNIQEIDNEIRIPMDYIEKIDEILRTGMSIYNSRDEFIKSAVEIKLADLKRGVNLE